MDFVKAIKDKKTEQSELITRMNDDDNLVNLEAFVLKDADGNKIPRAISVTLPKPAVYAAFVESALGDAVEDIQVTSEDKKVDCSYIDDTLTAAFSMANFRLMRQGRPYTLNSFIDQAMCRRGGCAARCQCYLDKEGQLIVDIKPWDRLYTYYWEGTDGLSAAAHETIRSKDDIEAEYPLDEYPKAVVAGKTGTVIDGWDGEANYIYIDGKLVDERENIYTPGSPPVVVKLVPMGAILVSKNNAHEGESIFFLMRGIVPEMNRMVSLIQSLNQKELDHALTWPSEVGIGIDKESVPSHDDLTKPGNVVAVDKGTRPEPIALGELKQQLWLLNQKLEDAMEEASYNAFQAGTFNQPMSAIALITVGEGGDRLYKPRLGARGLMNQQLSYMIIEQLTNLGQNTVDIGVRGHKRPVQVSKLQGEYDIEFNYYIKSPKIDAARYALAGPAWGRIPDIAIYRDILQREDPEGDLIDLQAQQAGDISPVIKMHRSLMALVEKADGGDENAALEAEILKAQIKAMMGQAGAPQLPEEAQAGPPQGEGESVIDIFNEKTPSQQRGGATKAVTNQKKIPAGEE